jgi:CRP-like cAMP-binding protein
MPTKPRSEVDRKTRLSRELFLRVLVLSKPKPAVARALADAITDVRFAPGQVVYRAGEDPLALFWITSGEVDLVSEIEGEDAWHFGAGAVVGILDVILSRPRARTAVARTEVEAMKLRSDDWLEVLEDNPDYMAELRRDVPGDMFDNFHQALAPDGGWPDPTPDDGRAAWLDMTAVERLVALRESPYLETASVQAVVELSRAADVVYLRPGEVLFAPGGAGDHAYLVAAGIVAIERAGAPALRARFGRGQLVGGGAAFTDRLATFRATAEGEAIVLRLRHGDIDDACEDHFDLARAISRGTALDRDALMSLRGRRQRGASVEPPAPAPVHAIHEPDAAE